jgi:hypothetical protein
VALLTHRCVRRASFSTSPTNAAASTQFQSPTYCCWNVAIPSWTTRRSGSDVMVSGQTNEFQLARKKNTASADKIGLDRGRITLR